MAPHGNLSPGVNRAVGHSNTVADDLVQSHHFIQDAWARQNVTGYSRNSAPAILLKSRSGQEHALISAAQRARRRAGGFSGNITEEFNIAYREMIEAGVPVRNAQKAAGQAYKYFDSLGAF